MAHAFIDERIQELLEKALLEKRENTQVLLEKVLKGKNPLDSFPDRVNYAKRFYQIPNKLVKSLDKFNKLRNEFAHRSHRGELCLEDVDRIYGAMEASDQAEIDSSMEYWHSGFSAVCGKFVAVAAHIYYELGRISVRKRTTSQKAPSNAGKDTGHPPQ